MGVFFFGVTFLFLFLCVIQSVYDGLASERHSRPLVLSRKRCSAVKKRSLLFFFLDLFRFFANLLMLEMNRARESFIGLVMIIPSCHPDLLGGGTLQLWLPRRSLGNFCETKKKVFHQIVDASGCGGAWLVR